MTPDEFSVEVEECFSKMREILVAKGNDYATQTDRFSNFRLSEAMGIPAWKGIVIRMGDKLSRILNLTGGKTACVTDEGIEDTLLDLANYALLCLLARRDSIRKAFDMIELGATDEDIDDEIPF